MLYRLRGHEVGTCILVLTCWPSSVTKIDLTLVLPRPAKLPVEELDSADNSNEIEGHARANGKSSVLHPSFVAFPSISMPEVLFPPTHTLTRSLSHSMSKISAQIPSSEIVVEFALLSRPEVNRLRLGWFLTWNFQNEAMLPYEYYFLTLCKHWLQISQVAPSAQIPQSSLLPALLICLVMAEEFSRFFLLFHLSNFRTDGHWGVDVGLHPVRVRRPRRVRRHPLPAAERRSRGGESRIPFLTSKWFISFWFFQSSAKSFDSNYHCHISMLPISHAVYKSTPGMHIAREGGGTVHQLHARMINSWIL